jgi:HEAT repeat protein
MTKLVEKLRPLAFVLGLALGGVACHADQDDPAGQAQELSDPVRREYAIGNLTRLYGKALADAKSDRNAAPVKQIVDASIDQLVKTYIEHPEDNHNGELILSLLFEMRDPRSLPALMKALEWRTEVNEEHAITAARTIAVLDVPADKKGEIVKKISEALERVTGKRPVDNRMRIEFITTLGALNDKAAVDALTKVVVRQSEEQNFLINNLAAQQLAKLADPASVPALMEALYLFDPSNPANRLNKAAGNALVRIGRPALEPLLKVLKGEDPKALALSKQWIEAIRQRAPQAVENMKPDVEMKKEAVYALGQLGLPEATDPLLKATTDSDPGLALGAAAALASIQRKDADTPRIREALIKTYQAQEKISRMQLLRAMQHLYDPGLQSFLLGVAKAPEEELPDIRVIALNAYSMLANKAEAVEAQKLIAGDDSPYKANFEQQNKALLEAAVACDQDIACWTKKLDDKDVNVARKAAYMLARLGRGKPEVIATLTSKIDEPREEVRGDVLYALDFVAVNGAPEAVTKIAELEKVEKGRAIWSHVGDLAMTTAAHLAARSK